jgi:dihydroflavonol-4-reductase
MKVLVTGATGLIGHHVASALGAAGHDVAAMVRPGRAPWGLRIGEVEVRHGDVLDTNSLIDSVRGTEAVVHVAGMFAYGSAAAAAVGRTNVHGTRNVLAAAATAGVRRVVVTSSSVVFGSSTSPVERDESSAFYDRAAPAYYVAKHLQHVEAFRLGEELGIEVVAACPTVTLGGPDPHLAPSNAIITDYLDDPWKATWSGGVNVVDVRDVAAGHALLLGEGEPGGAYVLGGTNLTWRELHAAIGELTGAGGPNGTTWRGAVLLTAAWSEARARIAGGRPGVTRDQSRTIGRYYWYTSGRAAALGYTSRPVHETLVEAVGWMARHRRLSAAGRSSLRLHPAVRAAQVRHEAVRPT